MGALSPRAAFLGSLRGKKRYRCSRRHGLSLRYAGGKRLSIVYTLDPTEILNFANTESGRILSAIATGHLLCRP